MDSSIIAQIGWWHIFWGVYCIQVYFSGKEPLEQQRMWQVAVVLVVVYLEIKHLCRTYICGTSQLATVVESYAGIHDIAFNPPWKRLRNKQKPKRFIFWNSFDSPNYSNKTIALRKTCKTAASSQYSSQYLHFKLQVWCCITVFYVIVILFQCVQQELIQLQILSIIDCHFDGVNGQMVWPVYMVVYQWKHLRKTGNFELTLFLNVSFLGPARHTATVEL